MLTAETTEFQDAIAELQRQGRLPAGLSSRQVTLLQRGFNQYANEVGQSLLDNLLQEFQDKVQAAAAGPAATVGKSDLLYNLTANVGEDIADRLKFGMGIAQEVVAGAGRYLNQNLSPEVLDEYPALALQRFYSRMVPRGFKRSGKTIVPVPDDDWPARWAEAGDGAGDDDWLPWEGSSQGGRGVALKSSGIWEALGSLRDDSLGNPFPPFAFNSGFMTKEVSRSEAEQLGLLKPGDAVEGPKIDMDKLFSPIQ